MDLKSVAAMLHSLDPAQRAGVLNGFRRGFDAVLGLCFVSADSERVVATLAVQEAHTQPYGLVHGGVYAALGESVCSVGAALSVMAQGLSAVGAENHTRFLRGTRPGCVLTVVAMPIASGGGDGRPVWEATITDDAGRCCAISRVTLAVLPPGKSIAGAVVSLPDGDGPARP